MNPASRQQPVPPSSQQIDPNSCKSICSAQTPYCLHLGSTPAQRENLQRLYSHVSGLNPTETTLLQVAPEHQKIDLPLWGNVLVGSLNSPALLEYRRKESTDLVLEFPSEERSPEVLSNFQELNRDFGGKLKKIEFAGQSPILTTQSGCIAIDFPKN